MQIILCRFCQVLHCTSLCCPWFRPPVEVSSYVGEVVVTLFIAPCVKKTRPFMASVFFCKTSHLLPFDYTCSHLATCISINPPGPVCHVFSVLPLCSLLALVSIIHGRLCTPQSILQRCDIMYFGAPLAFPYCWHRQVDHIVDLLHNPSKAV